MPEYLTPGVYVEEIDTGNKPIEGVSTSTVGFLGVAERGPRAATFVSSATEFARTYGLPYKTDRPYYLAYAVEGFFLNGGQRCYVQAVSPKDAGAATHDAGAMSITAAGPGEWGNNVAVTIEKSSNGAGIRLTVAYYTTKPADKPWPKPQITEVYDDLDANPNSTSFYERQINNISGLVTVKQTKAELPVVLAATLLTGGTGKAGDLRPGDFLGYDEDPPDQKRGLQALAQIDDISLLCCPDAYAIAADNTVNSMLVNQCELLKDRFAIISSPSSPPVDPNKGSGLSSQYAAYYTPWLNVIDANTGLKTLIPPVGHVAGIYARSDDARGVQKAPANQAILGIDSLQFNMDDATQGELNPIGVDALRYFKGSGNVVWGARTTSINPDWKYINVRRLFIFIEKSILRATQWAVFEINDEPTWARVRRSISDFLTRLWMDDMLQGAKREEAFFVRCDRTTMTQSDIDNGRLICVIGIAPVKPAEFVIFRIGQWVGGSSVTE